MTATDLNQEYILLSKKYVSEELSKKLSAVWDKVSIFIYGSVSYGLADGFSNANIEVIYPDNEFTETKSFFVRENKKEIKVDFSPWSKYEGYITKPLQNAEYEYWVVQKAIILHDPSGRFHSIQGKINDYFPDNVWRDKIFGRWFDVAFNWVKKALERNDGITTQVCKGKMVQAMLELTFLLNRQYIPPVKWLHGKFLELPILSKEIEPHLNKILEIEKAEDMETENQAIRDLIGGYIKEKELLPQDKTDKPWMYV
ncbi:MAG: hypothetical protein ACD_22C00171G0002 [uncultured bacterium]|nr:MAG: hypothetical protein ACD_22C00171G0002 [uncultured bacterium]